jgi:hypothetical protein
MVVFVLAPYLFLTLPDDDRASKVFLGALGVYLAWFSILDIIYPLGGQLREQPWIELREILGLPTFLIAVVAVILLLPFRKSAVVVPPTPLATPVGRVKLRTFELAGAASADDARGSARPSPMPHDVHTRLEAESASASGRWDAPPSRS